MYTSIIVTGSIAHDRIMDFPGEFKDHIDPTKVHMINVSFVVGKVGEQLGGTGTNIAYNTQLLTTLPVRLLGGVGKDSADLLEFFKAHNIDTTGVIKDENDFSAGGTAITDQKDNQIWGFYHGASKRGKDIDLGTFCKPGEQLLVLSANDPEAFLHFQNQAIELGLNYFYDPGMALTWISDADLQKGMDHATFVAGNDYEIGQIEKRLRTPVQTWAKKCVIITTLGERGARYMDATSAFAVSGVRLDRPIDPTGAGDAFRGGFIAGLCEGLSVEDAMRQGSALGSFAVESYGTINHGPTREDISRRAQSLTVTTI